MVKPKEATCMLFLQVCGGHSESKLSNLAHRKVSVCLFVCLCVTHDTCVFPSEILSTKTLPEPTKREESVSWYPWIINNKYYTADVRLCVVPSTFQMSSEIAQSMQAFIAYFDSTVVRDSTVRCLVCKSLQSCVTCMIFAEGWSG